MTAVDVSDVATAQAVELDRAAGVSCERIVADLAEWSPEEGARWDSVFLIYLHCERAVRQRAVELACAAVPAGGWFIAEGFASNYDDGPRMGPDNRELLYDQDDLLAWAGGFELIEAMSGTVRLDEGARHQGIAQVVRLMARKMPGIA